MSNNDLEIYCVTNKRLKFLENFNYNLACVGKNSFPENYIRSDVGDNIFYKEEFYSELTFHYWFWKNKLNINEDKWIGFCQKRRFWIIKTNTNIDINLNNFKDYLLLKAQPEWNSYESIVCEPIFINKLKKMKLIKKGFMKILKKPSIFYNLEHQNIALHFDLHHGNGNLFKAIEVMDKSDRDDFYNYVNHFTYYNPHIMFITKPHIHQKWFSTLFPWLERCEKVFGFEKLKGYETKRLYAYLAERYLSFWFKKYTKSLNWPWTFIENQ